MMPAFADPPRPMSSTPASSLAAPAIGGDARVIGLVGLAHGSSHFFQIMLPPLFPMFIRDFGLSYSELGLLVSTFYIISGVGQALAGFLVDRVGARPVLFGALACFALAAFATAGAQGYYGLMLAAMLAGIGNAPFHPVDFTILNQRVSQPRLGHAFSVHGISGNIGWAMGPVFMTGISALSGSWRVAAACAGLWGIVVLALLFAHRDAVDDRRPPAKEGGRAAAAGEHQLAFLKLPSVWMCFSFFFWSTCALAAVQSFASPALHKIYGLPLTATSLVVTGYMLASAAGMVAGGFLVARAERLERVIGASLFVGALLLALAGTGLLSGLAAAIVAALAGAGSGLAGPSRDMLIKQAAPPGATGRVYGMVYSGLDLGFALAAPIFGALLDHGRPDAIFYGAALALLLGIGSAGLVGVQIARRRGAAAAAA